MERKVAFTEASAAEEQEDQWKDKGPNATGIRRKAGQLTRNR